MPYLIDGYNLLHALGLLSGRVGPKGLEAARLRLLAFLRGAVGAGGGVTVVFDAKGAPPGVKAEQEVEGIHVHFAVGQDEADDLIELLIQRDAAPRQLAVVSDDHRLQRAARRRHCTALGCAAFLEVLDRQRRQRSPPAAGDEKADGLSAAELQHWLDEFAGLETDPDLKELSDLYRFGEEP